MTPEHDYLIAHATDLDPDGGVAFAHGVALAERMSAPLYTFFAASSRAEARRPMPEARELLARWRSSAELEHHRVAHTCCEDPVDTLLDAMRSITPDLMVVGTHQLGGLRRLVQQSVAEGLARNIDAPTLFLPIGQPGFVDAATGALELDTILVPTEDPTTLGPALAALGGMLRRLELGAGQVLVLHVGAERPLRQLELPELMPGWRYTTLEREGNIEQRIQDVALERDVDLVVMATRGHDSLLDLLGGTHTEHIVRRVGCPVLSVPVARP